MRPAVYSVERNAIHNDGWIKEGKDIKYYKNHLTK